MEEKKTVLVVDDEESLVNVLSRKLTDEGLHVLTAVNGKDGLAVALEKHPDLTLLDIMMPEMDGFEVIRELRQDAWGKTAQVIFLTNSSSIETVAQAVSTGMNEFLVKSDMRLDDIVKHVKERLSRM